MRLHPHALRILTAGVVLSAVLLTGCSGGGGGGWGSSYDDSMGFCDVFSSFC